MNLASKTAPLDLHPAVERCRHPAKGRMLDLLLDIRDDLTGIGLVPGPIEPLGHDPELDEEVAGQILRLDFAALFPPEPKKSSLIVPHDDPGVGAADEGLAIYEVG